MRVWLAAALFVAGCNGGSSSSSNQPPACVRENDEFTCTSDGRKWPACPGLDIRRGACATTEPVCMGCNVSVGGFTCRCQADASAVTTGDWFCMGTGAGCR